MANESISEDQLPLQDGLLIQMTWVVGPISTAYDYLNQVDNLPNAIITDLGLKHLDDVLNYNIENLG